MSKETVFIVNPNSNSGLTGKNWNNIYDMLTKYFGNNSEIVHTKKAGDGTLLCRQYLKKGFKNIIPIGGDGMINEVINGFFKEVVLPNNIYSDKMSLNTDFIIRSLCLEPINPDAILTVLPCGTRNVFVHSLGLPQNMEECCKIVTANNATKAVDVVMSVYTTDNKQVEQNNNVNSVDTRLFLNAAEIGLGGQIISTSKEIRNKVNNRLLSTIAGVLATIPTYKGATCEILIDYETNGNAKDKLITNISMGIVANGRFLGGGFLGAPQANMQDGLLDVLIIKNSDGIEILNKLANLRNEQSLSTNEGIYYSQSSNVVFLSEKTNRVMVTVDGEPIGILPSIFKVFPNSINIRF